MELRKRITNYELRITDKSIYFLGIGGIGVSAIARLYLSKGYRVIGSDLTDSALIQILKKEGVEVVIGEESRNLKKEEVTHLIYTTSVPPDHPVLLFAQKNNIPIKSYPEMLGEISEDHYTVAVSGMHGKSTTTAMLGVMLEDAGLDPLVIVGTIVPQWKSNIRIPNLESRITEKKIFVVEADEYKGAMLNLHPDIIVLTRVEEDHLDYYKDLAHITEEFKKYVNNLDEGGYIVANWKDRNIIDITSHPKPKGTHIVKYNAGDNALRAEIKSILQIPGKHNLDNTLAAYRVGEILGLKREVILEGLAKFTGTWRRLETVGSYQIKNKQYEIPIISDYGHHPTEIVATLQAVKEKYPDKRLVLAYQPHQHNRTKTLFNKFIPAFKDADVIILNEIFDVAGREEDPDQDVSSKDIVDKILEKGLKSKENCMYSPNLKKTKEKICEIAKKDDILLIMGAGDIDRVARDLVTV